ncbi:MAG: selenium-dependent molybdenum cofactor biosynthesis protein YqeB [Dehalococcoidia bacterium]|nr:selenium-dependent molybdenum cofactor biosynthesis protein YqeB [Dehalococcoidia bacterium]
MDRIAGKPLDLTILVKGAGEIASGIAYKLAQSHFKICLTDLSKPMAVRREVSFCEAVYEGEKTVEGITARLIASFGEIEGCWRENKLPLLVDPRAEVRSRLKPDVVVDAIIAKKNVGTSITDAPLVIGVGPGFAAGVDVHVVVETNRGHNLGRIIRRGEAEKNTGIPGEIMGLTEERVIRSPSDGVFKTGKKIGDRAGKGEEIARVNGLPVIVNTEGILRGLLRDGTNVWKGMKVGDIDPRGVPEYCLLISDKSRTIAGGVLEAVLERFNS